VACMRNFWAFTVYGLAWTGVFLGAGIAASVVAALLAVMGLGAGIMAGIMVGTAMLLAAMFFTSVVFSFRDCFEPPERMPPTASDAYSPTTSVD
jgi:hypothetical protein